MAIMNLIHIFRRAMHIDGYTLDLAFTLGKLQHDLVFEDINICHDQVASDCVEWQFN